MKTSNWYVIVLVLFVLVSCNSDDPIFNALDSIGTEKYYPNEIIPAEFNDIYGVWAVASTSGGFSGSGYKKDFDYLVLKKHGIFGIVRNDSLISFGKLTLMSETFMNVQNSLFCRFDVEGDANVMICGDREKYIQLINKDSLDLLSPCCDRYDTHFKRKK